jgi:transcriptional regulator with XRE-family HTH domain
MLFGDLPHFWTTIDQLRTELRLPHARIADLLGLTPSEYWLLRRRNKEPSVSSSMELSKRLNIGFESLILNQFDLQAVVRHFHGDLSHLPEKYAVGALSKRRTIIHLLNYIESYFGRASRAMILQEFQVTEAIFNDPDAPINLRFAVDLGSYILGYQKNPQTLIEMGKHSVFTTRHSPISTLLQEERTPLRVMEKMVTDITPRLIEANYQWEIISAEPTCLTLAGRPSQDLRSYLEPHYINSFVACMFRQGVMSAVPAYVGFPLANVKKTACVSQGDPQCRFEVHFQPTLQAVQNSYPNEKSLLI